MFGGLFSKEKGPKKGSASQEKPGATVPPPTQRQLDAYEKLLRQRGQKS